MDTPSVSGSQPIYGIQSTHRDRQQKGNREAFQRAFQEHADDAEPEETAGKSSTPPRTYKIPAANTALQPSRPVIRKDPQDGEFHVDILA